MKWFLFVYLKWYLCNRILCMLSHTMLPCGHCIPWTSYTYLLQSCLYKQDWFLLNLLFLLCICFWYILWFVCRQTQIRFDSISCSHISSWISSSWNLKEWQKKSQSPCCQHHLTDYGLRLSNDEKCTYRKNHSSSRLVFPCSVFYLWYQNLLWN